MVGGEWGWRQEGKGWDCFKTGCCCGKAFTGFPEIGSSSRNEDVGWVVGRWCGAVFHAWALSCMGYMDDLPVERAARQPLIRPSEHRSAITEGLVAAFARESLPAAN